SVPISVPMRKGTQTKCLILLVLPARIERATSPLPRECSTTELRQQHAGRGQRRPYCHMAAAASSETPDRNRAILADMSGDQGDKAREAARKAREERLAAALRANLRRRKAGSRPPAESRESAAESPGEKSGD